MKPMAKTRWVWILIIISLTLTIVSFNRSMKTKKHINQLNQQSQIQEKKQPLMDKSRQLGQQINAELRAAIDENNAIIEELKKPKDLRPADLDQRQLLLKQRNEGIQKLLDEQRILIEQINQIQKQNGIVPVTENPETKAVLEKY